MLVVVVGCAAVDGGMIRALGGEENFEVGG